MQNFDFRNYDSNYEGELPADSTGQFEGMTPGKRISDEQFAQAGELSADAKKLLQKEIMRQLRQAEPVYKLVYDLREYVSDTLFKGVHSYTPAEIGFNLPVEQPSNIGEMIKRVEQTAKLLKAFYEDMQGMATEITGSIRNTSLELQTKLLNYALKFKSYVRSGDLDRSNKEGYYQELMGLNMFLGTEQHNLELMRGKIR
jgi:hypothetical protein